MVEGVRVVRALAHVQADPHVDVSGVIIVPPVMKVFRSPWTRRSPGRPAPHPHYDETCVMRP